jgi:hypothetical protein
MLSVGFVRTQTPVAVNSRFWYADLNILMERGTLVYELSPLCCNDEQEASKENETWLHNLLLRSLPPYLQ